MYMCSHSHDAKHAKLTPAHLASYYGCSVPTRGRDGGRGREALRGVQGRGAARPRLPLMHGVQRAGPLVRPVQRRVDADGRQVLVLEAVLAGMQCCCRRQRGGRRRQAISDTAPARQRRGTGACQPCCALLNTHRAPTPLSTCG